MNLERTIAVVLFTFCSVGIALGQAQTIDPQSIISDILEDIVASSEEDVDLDALTEDLIYFSENPINLNNTNAEELGKLVFLSDFQIISLLDYVKQHGKVITIYELQLIVGFDFNDIFRLVPFITIADAASKGSSIPRFGGGKHDMFIRARSLIETQEGYKPPPVNNPSATRYAGNKLGLYTRYSYRTRSGIQAGFVGEKDPGEEFFKGSNPYGFDHYSFHLQANDIGAIRTIVVGDFNAEFGQGLTMWSSASFGKSPDPMGVRKRAKGLNRSSSTNENEFLRGGGATVKFGKFDITAFGSYKKIDANISDSLINGEVGYSSLPISGSHRTPSEIKSKKTLGELVAGGNISFAWKNLKAGVTTSFVNLEGINISPSQPYRYFEPSLNNRTNVGVDFNYGIGNHMLFGEAATTLDHGSGIIAGGLFRLHPLLKLSILGRNYQKDYSTYYTAALSDGSSPSNEWGILTGFDFLPIKHWHLGGYADVFQSSWLKFGINAPSRGRDYLIQATYSPRSKIIFQLRYRLKQKEKNQEVDTSQTRWVVPYVTQGLRFHLSYSPTKTIQLKSRIEFSWYEEENKSLEKGLLLYQDISYRPITKPLVLTARFAVFETDTWNARIYAYENDVLYYFSIPAYYSRGSRVYFLAQYSFGRNIDIWFRVAQTFFADQKQLGSGLDLIDGPTRSDVRVQMRLKF
jgi:hypothetical protein